MFGADPLGPRFNIVILRDSHQSGYNLGSAGPLRHLVPPLLAICFVIPAMPVLMSSGAVTMTDASDFLASRIAVDVSFAIPKNGWCYTKTHIQRTSTGKPLSGIRN